MAAIDQVPTNSPYHAHSDGADVVADVDLTGKTAIVTGGYSGIGLEMVRALAARGASVVVPVRSPAKAAANLADVQGDVRTAAIDLAELGSVREFVDSMLADLDRLDLLINDAGIMACPKTRVGPGWESQFGVNHMGHFALTTALLPLIADTPGARVVSLTSSGHKFSDIRWDDLHFETGEYNKWLAYCQSKTANALFANALSRRLRDSGGLAFATHPGAIFTPLQRHLPKAEMIALGWLDERGQPSDQAKATFKTPQQGCATTLWAATSTALEGKPGVYCEDCDIATLAEPGDSTPIFRGVYSYACSDEAAEKLWAISEQLLADA